MFCQKCGTQNSDDDKFCSKCGNDLKSTIQAEKKGITGKLGKMGVPGFRSGKTWKMATATFVYLIFIMAIISGHPKESDAPLANPIAATDTPTAVQTQQQGPLVHKYSGTYNLKPRESKIYTKNDFFSNPKYLPTSDEIYINVSITALIGTMIEIIDKNDYNSCLDVVYEGRLYKMPSGRYAFPLRCNTPLY